MYNKNMNYKQMDKSVLTRHNMSYEDYLSDCAKRTGESPEHYKITTKEILELAKDHIKKKKNK